MWKRAKVTAQPPKESIRKPKSEAITKPETNEKGKEMQQHLDIVNSPGAIVIQNKGGGDININADLPLKKKKPLSDLYGILAKEYDEELKKI